jgi:hypothetical protein
VGYFQNKEAMMKKLLISALHFHHVPAAWALPIVKHHANLIS